MSLPPYYLEFIMTGGVACMVTVLMNGWRVLQVLIVSFIKGRGGFPYVFIITREVTTLDPIYGPTFADHRVFVLEGDQKVPDSITTFEVGQYVIPPTDVLDTFTETLCVRYDSVTLGFNLIGCISYPYTLGLIIPH